MRVATLLGTATVVTVLAGMVPAGGGAIAVSASSAARAPAAEKDSGFGVSLTPDATSAPVGARRAVGEFAATRRTRRIAVTISATGVARALGDTGTTLATRAGKTTRLDIAWSAVRDGAGTIELQARALDRHGKLLRTSTATLWVLRAGDRVFSGTAGLLDLQVRQIRALDGLSALERSLRLERVLGAGASVTTSTRAEPGTGITVSGTISFTDRNGTPHPARRLVVQLLESATSLKPEQLLTETATEEDGSYVMRFDQPLALIDLAHADGYNLTVRAVAKRAISGVVASLPFTIADANDNVYHLDAKLTRVRTGTAKTVNMTANNTLTNDKAFAIADTARDIADYLNLFGDGVEPVAVVYPSEGSAHRCSCYAEGKLNSDGKLYIKLGDAFDYDTIAHEYGHHVMLELGFGEKPKGDHLVNYNLSEDDIDGTQRGKGAGITFAWAEAWPTYYGTVIQNVLLTGLRTIPSVGDTHYTTTRYDPKAEKYVEDFDYDLESQKGAFDGKDDPRSFLSEGEDQELAIQRVLWDLFDAHDDAGDTWQIPNRAMQYLFKFWPGGPVKTFSQAYTSLVADVTPRVRARIGCIAAEHNISPDITSPANGSALTREPPKIVWDANGGGPEYRNNQFVVQFYDAEFSQRIDTLAVPPDRLYFTPSDAEWTKIRRGAGDAVNIIVRGTQTDDPPTGPYDSCALRLGA